jgi:hypothetical protein
MNLVKNLLKEFEVPDQIHGSEYCLGHSRSPDKIGIPDQIHSFTTHGAETK